MKNSLNLWGFENFCFAYQQIFFTGEAANIYNICQVLLQAIRTTKAALREV